jgi:hypothetical protein
MFALLYILHGKAYYLTPVYPVLMAGGAIVIEGWLAGPARRWAAAAVLIGPGAVAAPSALPILPPGDYGDYAHALGISAQATATESNTGSVLPQQLADMFGWRAMAKAVSTAYHSLPPDERARAVFFGRNYGEAAAIDVYGPAFHGPPAVSSHNSYYLWGPRGYDGSVAIVVGGDPAQYARQYQSIEPVGELNCPYAMRSETDIPVYVLRNRLIPFGAAWAGLKHYE